MDEYFSDIDWSGNSFSEFELSNIIYSLNQAGIEAPQIKTACELAFGMGVMISSYAASMPATKWYGTDLNQSHVELTAELGYSIDTTLSLFNEPFSEFQHRKDLPKFDLIVLTGTWSWISEDDRNNVVDFLNKHLKENGVFAVHYLTLPGSAADLPFRWQAMDYLPDPIPVGADVAKMIPELLDAVQHRLKVNHSYRRDHPLQEKFIEALRKKDPELVAHEFFNINWSPIRVKEMASRLKAANLNYGCTLQPMHNIDQVNLSTEQVKYLQGTTDKTERESAYDFFVDRSSRIDCWLKNNSTLTKKHETDSNNLKFLQVANWPPRTDVCDGALGTFQLDIDTLKIVLEAALAAKTTSLESIKSAIRNPSINSNDIKNSLWMLINLGILKPGFSSVSKTAVENCTSLNRKLFSVIEQSKANIGHIASPVIGGAIEIDPDLFGVVIGWMNGHRSEEELSDFVVSSNLKKQPANERLYKIQGLSKKFVQDSQHHFRALGII